MARFQNGRLQKKPRKSGDISVFCYRRQRPEDGALVQATRIGSAKSGTVQAKKQLGGAWKNSISILIKEEFPRFCRGGTRSLTNPGVHPRNS